MIRLHMTISFIEKYRYERSRFNGPFSVDHSIAMTNKGRSDDQANNYQRPGHPILASIQYDEDSINDEQKFVDWVWVGLYYLDL